MTNRIIHEPLEYAADSMRNMLSNRPNEVQNIPTKRIFRAMMNQTTLGYKLKSGQKLNHLQCMNDLKMYANTENELKALGKTVDICEKDIIMKF